ncbi:hypothetical protein ACF073_35550 [Streptomyces sp. NPDC015171]|uniref:hypothetical protein n=1 Tax=Streptomyces sp. NPDC015171 TaxID=3364945 RepID=UPI0036F5A4EF
MQDAAEAVYQVRSIADLSQRLGQLGRRIAPLVELRLAQHHVTGFEMTDVSFAIHGVQPRQGLPG